MASLHVRARHVLAALLILIAAVAVAPSSAPAFPNGRAPRSALARIYHPSAQLHVYLAKPAAAAFNTMVLLAVEDHASAPYVGGALSAYRNLAGQELLRRQWCAVGKCANAALPGTSNHGLGHAIDLANTATMRPWIDRHGAYFGWSKTWSDAPWEPWHILWRPGHWTHRPDPGPDPLSPRLAWGSGGRGQSYWVRQLQHYLHVHADGRFGPTTARALRRFRRAHHLKPTPAVTTHRVWGLLRNPGPAKHDTPPPRPIPVPKVPVKTTPVAAVATVVDVSNYQGSIEFTKVAHAGVSAVVEKTSEGLTYHDPRWSKARVHAIRAAHLVLGTYHFLRPQPGRSAAAEATFAVKAARAGGWRAKRDLPIGEDLETSAFTGHTVAAGWCAVADYGFAFAKRVRALTGRYPLLYSYPGFLNAIPTGCRKQLGVLQLWIAHYRVKSPIVPWPWSNAKRPGYTAWQYDDSGRIPGISGHVDLSLVAGGVPALHRLASAR